MTEKAREAEATLRRWHALVAGAEDRGIVDAGIVDLLADDLNTAGALARLHAMARELVEDQSPDGAGKGVFLASARLLGLMLPGMDGWLAAGPDLSALAARLVRLREEAKATRDFAALDAFKAALIDAGVTIRMNRDGVELDPSPSFDAAKLDALP